MIYKVKQIKNPQPICVSVPGSKSITNRALLIAALANGRSTLKGVLFSDDSRHFIQALIDLGFEVLVDEENCIVTIEGIGGAIPKNEATIDVGSAGTAVLKIYERFCEYLQQRCVEFCIVCFVQFIYHIVEL